MGLKTCPKCKETKPYDLFYANRQSPINCSPYCKVCSNLRSTSYARNNKEKIPTTGYSLKRRYGITSEDYEAMLVEQGYRCAICRVDRDINGRNFAVDHCHITKKVRGLLCSSCNTGLGHFKDNWQTISSALNYIERHEVENGS